MTEALESRVGELIRPSTTEVRRTKRAILAILKDGHAHTTPKLMLAAGDELDAERTLGRLEIVFQANPDPTTIQPEEPSVVYIRSRLAAMRGLAELTVAGVIVPAACPRNEEPNHDPIATVDDTISVGIRHPGGSFGVRPAVDRPAIAQAYMLAEPGEVQWYMDPDLFSEELAGLDLTNRAERALREALRAFRRRLYMACTALLGVVNEAAWYKAAERLGTPPLVKLIEDEATAKIQERVAEHLRGVKGLPRTLPNELLSHAAVLRDLRNYGVHPAKVRDDLERYFTEETCALLIVETHHHLTSLASGVDTALTAWPPKT